MTPSHLPLSTVNGHQIQGHPDFKALCLVSLAHFLIRPNVTTKDKWETLYGESNDTVTFELE